MIDFLLICEIVGLCMGGFDGGNDGIRFGCDVCDGGGLFCGVGFEDGGEVWGGGGGCVMGDGDDGCWGLGGEEGVEDVGVGEVGWIEDDGWRGSCYGEYWLLVVELREVVIGLKGLRKGLKLFIVWGWCEGGIRWWSCGVLWF